MTPDNLHSSKPTGVPFWIVPVVVALILAATLWFVNREQNALDEWRTELEAAMNDSLEGSSILWGRAGIGTHEVFSVSGDLDFYFADDSLWKAGDTVYSNSGNKYYISGNDTLIFIMRWCSDLAPTGVATTISPYWEWR